MNERLKNESLKDVLRQLVAQGVRWAVLALAVAVAGSAWALDYTYSNVDSDSLAVKSDGKFGKTSFSFQLSNPSANAAAANFPASGYVQLTSISIGYRTDDSSNYKNIATATLTNNKTSESYTATVTYNESTSSFTASLNETICPSNYRTWSCREVLLTFATDGVLVDTAATYTLTFKNSSGAVATLGYSVVTTVASGTQTGDWKPAMRIYGRTPSGSMEMPSSLIPSSCGVSLPSTVTVSDAANIAFANDSITVGDGGISVALSPSLSYHTVMVKVSNIPSSSCRLIAWLTGQFQNKDLENFSYYDGSNFCQSFIYDGTKQGDYNTGDSRSWTRDASEHWVAASYARKDSESGCSQTARGTRTYFDGVEKVTAGGLNWSGNQTSKITIGGTSTNSENPATGMVIEDVIIFSNALTANQIATVTAALNKGWEVSANGATLTSDANGSVLPGYANVTVVGSVTVASDGTLNLSGLTAVQVGSGATFDASALSGLTQVYVQSGGELTIGKQRPSQVIVMAGGTLNVSSIPTINESLTGYMPTATLTTMNDSTFAGTIKLDGETVTPVIDSSTVTLTGTTPIAGDPSYTGDSWWWDYEFNGTVTSIGSDKVSMYTESDASVYYNSTELYFQQTPWRNATFSDKNELTAVMYCAPGNYANTVLVGFGSTTQGDQKAIALVTGANPAAGEMKLVLTDGHNGGTGTVTELADLTAVGATTTKHLYAFVMDRITENETTKTRVRVYLDGKVKAIYKHNGTLTLSNGFQIGSLHGGVYPRGSFNTGLTKYSATGNSGTLDFLRVTDGTLTDAAMSALAEAYPYHSEFGTATRDPISSAANWVATDAWTQKVPNQSDATQDAPNADTNVKLSIDGSSAVSVALNLTTDSNYESLTLGKEAGATGSLKITSAYNNATTGKLVSAETSVLVDTTVPAGRVHLGITSVGDGVTLTVDPYSRFGSHSIYSKLVELPLGGVWEDEIISMALLGEGASVTLGSQDKLNSLGFTAELVYNESNQSYTYRLTRESASEAGDITATANSDGSVAWSTHGIALPAPETIPFDYANTVTIDALTYDVTIPTAFAGGNVVVAESNVLVYGPGGSVALTGDITTSGTVTFNRETTLSGNTVSSALTGTGAVTIIGTVTLNGSIANTINGSGTLALSSIPKTLSFGNWTGTVVLPANQDFGGTKFDDYGIAGSTVRLQGANTGWFHYSAANNTDDRAPVATTVEIPSDASLTVTGWSSSFANTFNVLKGAGTFAVNISGNIDISYSDYSAYFLLKDVSNFTGSLSATGAGIAIGASKPAYTTTGGKIILTTSATIATGKTWTATGGIVLADAEATLTVDQGATVTTDPPVSTTLTGSHVFKNAAGVYSAKTDKTVTFVTVRGTAPAAQTVYHGAVATKPEDPTATNWTFKGWLKEDELYDFSTAVTENITLTADWEESKVEVDSTAETTLIAIPCNCQADGLVDTSNRYEGDILQVYNKQDHKYYTWTLDGEKHWIAATTFVTSGDEESEHSSAASDIQLHVGQAAWLTRKSTESKAAPIKLLVAYVYVEGGTPVALEAGTTEFPKWNLVASPSPESLALSTLAEQVGANDTLLVPTAGGAPRNVRKSGGKLVYDGYKVVNGKKIPCEKEVNEETIPAGTGFWYISVGTGSINL